MSVPRVVAVVNGVAAVADAETPEGRVIPVADVPGLDAWVGATSQSDVPGATPLPFDALMPDAAAAYPDLPEPDALARTAATALYALSANGRLEALIEEDPAAQALTLRRALPHRATPPRLKNDCFAMPQGVDWVPVDAALERLRAALHPVTGTEPCAVMDANGRVLATDVVARRSHPPTANAAVDGYGFAAAAAPGAGPHRLPLIDGRAAAGQPFDATVPEGAALRILTGAAIPPGVDTVVLEEDVALDGAAIVFDGPLKPGANTRAAGEDVRAGAVILPAGHRVPPPDLALMSAVGISEVEVHRPLRVGVLSTGDEVIATPGAAAEAHQIWDANRPMLLSLIAGWGYEAVDFRHVRDDPQAITDRLNEAATRADVLITSGGASAGDEDHISALLAERGTLSSWRIALKPGRPLALALWNGMPVIGLPGNPVAALVCTLIFGRPALSLLSGAGWVEAQAFTVPAAFSKRKKPGRREYLRARLTEDGAAEVFASEGSGRISGLSWATGLVELPDGEMQVTPGTAVRFLPFTGFGMT